MIGWVASTYASVTDYALVVLFGSLVGIAELVARYRDAPLEAIRTLPALFYVGVNAAASGGALAVTRVFDWGFGQSQGDAKRLLQVLVSGFSAIALFRTSLFIVHVAGQDVGVGPSSFLQVMLGAADRSVDRIRARARAKAVSAVMAGVSFSKAHAALPAYCLALMQNVSPEDQADLARDVDALRTAPMDDRAKVLNLGLALMNIVGQTALKAAVESLGKVIMEGDDEGSSAAREQGQTTTGTTPDAPEGRAGLPPIPPAPGGPAPGEEGEEAAEERGR